MSDDELNVAVAELCGWTEIHKMGGMTPEEERYFGRRWIERFKEYSSVLPLPNYAQDLNACAEFEKTLTPEEYRDYVALLALSANDPEGPDGDERFARRLISATATQRCAAFLAICNISSPKKNTST